MSHFTDLPPIRIIQNEQVKRFSEKFSQLLDQFEADGLVHFGRVVSEFDHELLVMLATDEFQREAFDMVRQERDEIADSIENWEPSVDVMSGMDEYSPPRWWLAIMASRVRRGMRRGRDTK